MRRASLDAGGANAATPLLRALGRDVLPVGVDRDAMLEAARAHGRRRRSVGVEAAARVRRAARTRAGPEPPAATMEWLRARCRAGEGNQVSFAAHRRLARAVGTVAGGPPDGVAGGEPVRSGPARRRASDALRPRQPGSARRRRATRCGCRAAVKLLQGDAHRELGRRRRALEAGAARRALRDPSEYAVRGDVLADGADRHRRSRGEPGDRPRAAVGDAGGPRRQARLSRRRPRRGCFIAWPRSRPSARRGSRKPSAGRAGRAGRWRAPAPRAKLEAINQQFDAIDVAMQVAGSEAADRARRSGRAGGRPAGRRRSQHCSASRSRACRRSGSRRSRSRWRGGSATAGSCRASLRRARRRCSKDPGSGAAFNYAPGGSQFRLYGVGGDGHDDGGDPGKDVVADAQEPPRLAP